MGLVLAGLTQLPAQLWVRGQLYRSRLHSLVLGSTGCRLTLAGLGWDDWVLQNVVSASSRRAHAPRTAGHGSAGQQELLGLLSNWHTIAPAAFCWPEQVRKPAQIQGVGNRLVILIGVSAKSHGRGCGCRKVGKVGAIVTLTFSSLKNCFKSQVIPLPEGGCSVLTPCRPASVLGDFSSWLAATLCSTTEGLFWVVSICPKIILPTPWALGVQALLFFFFKHKLFRKQSRYHVRSSSPSGAANPGIGNGQERAVEEACS